MREIQKFQRDFEATEGARRRGRSLEELAGHDEELDQRAAGDDGRRDWRNRCSSSAQAAAQGEGQMRATMDLAKEMGSNVQRQQEMRKARGTMLFQEYKKKMGMVQPEAAATAQPPAAPERQKIAE